MSTPPPAHLEAARRRAQARDDERALTARIDNAVSPTDRNTGLTADPLTEDDEVTMVDMRGLGAKALHRLVSAAHGRGIGADEISAALHELCVQDEPSMEAPAWAAGAATVGGGNTAGAQGSAPPSGQGGGSGGNGRGGPKWKPPQEGPVGDTRAAVHAMLLQLIPADGAVWSELRDPLCMKVPCEARPVLRDVLNNPTLNAANVVSYLLSSTIYQDEMTAEGVYYRYLRVVSMFMGLACEPRESVQYGWREVAMELTDVYRDLAIVREIAQAKVSSGEGLVARAETQESVRGLLLKLLLGRDFRIERTVPLHVRLPDALKAAIETPTTEMAEVLAALADHLGPQPLMSAYTDDGYPPSSQDGPEYDAARLVWCIASYVGEAAESSGPVHGAGMWNTIAYKTEQLERDLNVPMRKREEERARRGAGWLAPLRSVKPQSARRILLIGALAASVPVFILGALSAYLAAAMGWLG